MIISTESLLDVAIEMVTGLSEKKRFDRLLDCLRNLIHCDAVVLMRYQGAFLVPLAARGLMPDVVGRHFKVEDHPRLAHLSRLDSPYRFPSDSTLPDPFDGVVLGKEGELSIHACMGFPLFYQGKRIGLLTLDNLTPNAFDALPDRLLKLISGLAASAVHTAMMMELLETQAQSSRSAMNAMNDSLLEQPMIGESEVMNRLKLEISLVGATEYPVLIQGETGTGKDLVANALHRASPRQEEAFIQVNCAALSEQLIESELFGHVKGAFTGAERDREGKIQAADGGTLFLDEIGELPLSAQSKLLRVLQSGEVQTLGMDKVRQVNFRLVAATNRDLAQEVQEGRFREDLLHRLRVYPIQVPALRERTGDIQRLAGFFLEQARKRMGWEKARLELATLSVLSHYPWPGNVRELEHVISRACLMASVRAKGERVYALLPEDLDIVSQQSEPRKAEPLSLATEPPVASDLSLKAATEAFQADLIRTLLREEQGNLAAVARRLEMDRGNLAKKANKLGVVIKKSII